MKKRPPSSVPTPPVVDAISVASQLFEETIALAEEEGNAKDASTFASFIVDMLPSDVLETLKAVAGFSDDDASLQQTAATTSSAASSLNSQDLAFLTDIWSSRFNDEPQQDEKYSSSLPNNYCCELCDRRIQTTRHHVYPRECHSWLQARDPSNFTDRLLGTTINLCTMCHSAIHRFYTNRELAEVYCSLELLLESEKVCAFAKWVSSLQGRGNLKMK